MDTHKSSVSWDKPSSLVTNYGGTVEGEYSYTKGDFESFSKNNLYSFKLSNLWSVSPVRKYSFLTDKYIGRIIFKSIFIESGRGRLIFDLQYKKLI